MDSGNLHRDLKVRLQQTSNKGRKLFAFAFPRTAFGKSSVGRFDCQDGVLWWGGGSKV